MVQLAVIGCQPRLRRGQLPKVRVTGARGEAGRSAPGKGHVGRARAMVTDRLAMMKKDFPWGAKARQEVCGVCDLSERGAPMVGTDLELAD